MANVTLTAALRANLLSLQGTATLLDQTQLRLASGRKVNSALDNPTSFFAAQSLTNRASDLGNLLDGMGQAIQVLTAADQGIQNLTKLVQQAQSIAQSAQNTLSSTGAIRSGDMTSTIAGSLTGGGTFTAGNTIVISTTPSGGALTTAGTITITAGMTLSQLAAAINTLTGVSAQVVDGSSTSAAGSKRLEIRATNGAQLRLTNGVGTAVATLATNMAGAGGVAGYRLDTGVAFATGVDVAATSNTADQVSLEAQYRTVRSQIDALVTDSGYQGTNLINGDTLKVQFNEKNTSKLTVAGTTLTSSALGISYSETPAATAMTFMNSTNITTALNEITAALTTLRSQAQTYGNNLTIVQTRQDFTKNLINTLKAGSDLLTLADKNEEGANLLSLQTAQQLGIQALSLASQANQSVLRLFG